MGDYNPYTWRFQFVGIHPATNRGYNLAFSQLNLGFFPETKMVLQWSLTYVKIIQKSQVHQHFNLNKTVLINKILALGCLNGRFDEQNRAFN